MRSWLTATAAMAAILLAGCTNTGTSTAASSAAAVPAAWPAGTKAQALAEARHLLALLRLPPGTKPVHLTALPSGMRAEPPPGAGWAAAGETLLTSRNPRAVWALLDAGPPFGMPAQYGPVLPQVSGIVLPAPAPGVDAAQVVVGVAPYASGKTLIAAYAYAAWLPYRTAAEYLDPSRFRSVTATVRFSPIQPGPTTTRAFTSPVTIAKLAALLNASAPEPGTLLVARSCAPVGPVFTLTFTPKPARGPAVGVTAGFCGGIGIDVNGKPQPPLWDMNGRLATTIRTLLGNPQPTPLNTQSLASAR
jgi:hypothetical protein